MSVGHYSVKYRNMGGSSPHSLCGWDRARLRACSQPTTHIISLVRLRIHYSSRGMQERLLKVSAPITHCCSAKVAVSPSCCFKYAAHNKLCVKTVSCSDAAFICLATGTQWAKSAMCAVHVSTPSIPIVHQTICLCAIIVNKCRTREVFSEMCVCVGARCTHHPHSWTGS